MSYSYPEANSNKPRRSHLPGFIALVLVIAAGGLFVKSTLAANINLSSGRSIEFGQAVSQAVACSGDQNVTVTPKSSFVNASNASGSHHLGAVTVANIPTSCANKDFVINVYPDTATAAGVIFGSTRTLRFYFGASGDAYSSSDSTDLKVTSETQTCASPASGSCRSITLSVVNPSLGTNSDSKITLMTEEKSSWSCAKGGACVAGETGPGGGVVFYVAPTTFTSAAPCGSNCKYLEAAPNTWNGAILDPGLAVGAAISDGTQITPIPKEIGKGYESTNLMPNAAAKNAVWGVNIGGKTDWYIGTKNEYIELCAYASTNSTCATTLNVARLTSAYALTSRDSYNYWTSNVMISGTPGQFIFFSFRGPGYGGSQADQYADNRNGNKNIRPIRAFGPA
jgi:hypothetical protein